MVISIPRVTRARNVSLILAAFLFMLCGCSDEPVVVEIAYETQAISESSGVNSQSAPVAGDTGGANEGWARDDDAVNAALSQEQGPKRTPETAYQASAAPPLSPAVTQTPQPTFTPFPTPTLTPSPTPKPTPTATPSPTPTAISTPSPEPTGSL